MKQEITEKIEKSGLFWLGWWVDKTSNSLGRITEHLTHALGQLTERSPDELKAAIEQVRDEPQTQES